MNEPLFRISIKKLINVRLRVSAFSFRRCVILSYIPGSNSKWAKKVLQDNML